MRTIYKLIMYYTNSRMTYTNNKPSSFQEPTLEKNIKEKLNAIEREVLSYIANIDIALTDTTKIQAFVDYIGAEVDLVKNYVRQTLGASLQEITSLESEQQTATIQEYQMSDAEIKDRRIRQINHELHNIRLDFNPKAVPFIWLLVILLSIGDIFIFSKMYSNFSLDNNLLSLIVASSLGLAVGIMSHFYPKYYRKVEPKKKKLFVISTSIILTLLFWSFSVIRTSHDGQFELMSFNTIFFTLIGLFLFFASAVVSSYLPSKEQRLMLVEYNKLNKERNNLIQDIKIIELESKNMYLKQNAQKIDTLTKLSYQKSLLDSIDGAKESMIKKFAIHLTLFTKK